MMFPQLVFDGGGERRHFGPKSHIHVTHILSSFHLDPKLRSTGTSWHFRRHTACEEFYCLIISCSASLWKHLHQCLSNHLFSFFL